VDPAGICPRCGRNSNFVRTSSPVPLAFRPGMIAQLPDGSTERLPYERVSTFECLGCHQGIAVIEELTIGNQPWREWKSGGMERWPGVNWWPPASGASVDDAVPDRIRETFAEGLRCLSAKAPRAAAVMFGRTLEAIVRNKGSEQAVKALERKLAAALEVMATEGVLSKDLAEWAKELRLARNAGGHDELLDDVTPEEARNLSKFLDQLLINLYVMPARLRRAKEKA